MKRLLLLLAVLTIGLVATAQEKTKATYQVVSTAGYSNGLNLPDTFYVTVPYFDLRKNAGGFYFKAYTKTFIETWTDSLDLATVTGYVNDSIPKNVNYPITGGQLTTYTLPVIFNNTIELEIKNKFGAGNVTKLE